MYCMKLRILCDLSGDAFDDDEVDFPTRGTRGLLSCSETTLLDKCSPALYTMMSILV